MATKDKSALDGVERRSQGGVVIVGAGLAGLFTALKLAPLPVTVIVGGAVPPTTLDGEIDLELAAGVQPGESRVLRGKGMPVLQGFGRGDHRVLVNVTVPRRLTDEQRRLLEEFDRASDDDTYRRDEGFFDKLKSAFR